MILFSRKIHFTATASLQHGAASPRQRGENPRNRGGHSGEERTGKKTFK